MPKRLIVTGAHGFVAGRVIVEASARWEVHALSRNDPLLEQAGIRWHRLDLRDPARLAELVRDLRPDAVIHTAALADIDFCQSHPDLAREVNVDLTRALTDLCATGRATLVLCSTDTVFDGEHPPYREPDAPEPVNVYAETKVAAEQIVAGLGPRGVIARLALVVGRPALGAGNAFLPRLIAALAARREVTVPEREIRTPIDVITAARALLELAGGDHHGVFHLGGNDALNRLDLTRRIAARLGFPVDLVVPIDPALLAGRAPRPRDVSLDNARARATLTTPMLDFDAALTLALPPPFAGS